MAVVQRIKQKGKHEDRLEACEEGAATWEAGNLVPVSFGSLQSSDRALSQEVVTTGSHQED